MSHKEQILKWSRTTAGIIRISRNSREPRNLRKSAFGRIEALRRIGDFSPEQSTLIERCATALEKML